MKKFLIACGLGVAVFVLVGFLLPGRYEVERDTWIAASRAELFATVSELRTWPEWTPWSRERDPDASWEFAGEGVGATMDWSGPEIGAGRLEILALEPPRLISYQVSFEDGSDASRGSLLFEDAGDGGTRVTWRNSGALDGVMMRWFGLFLPGLMGAQFERGLDGLRARHDREV